jgi:hypothetical protein
MINDDVSADDVTVLFLIVVMIIGMNRPRRSNMHKLTDGTNTQEEAPMTVNIL